MWYSARIIMKCIVGKEMSNYLFDEQIRLIEANTPEDAYEKALAIGRNEESEYENLEKEKVKWIFEGLYDLDIVGELVDGVEIISKRFRCDSSTNLIVPKDQLAIFFCLNNADKSAKAILRK
jgi:hypothetical protein